MYILDIKNLQTKMNLQFWVIEPQKKKCTGQSS